jgi:general secretion pathway protein G
MSPTRHPFRLRARIYPCRKNAHFCAALAAGVPSLEPRTSNLDPASRLAPESGLTLVELIITITIIGILATAALPVARFQVKREKERELRRDLWEMRDAIDRYKDAADRGGIQTKADSQGYPPDLQTLVDGVNVQDKKVRFLRAIPTDPMTKSTDWGMRSNQDDVDADSWGGQDVFDVYTKSYATGLDGTKYNTW